MWNKSQPLAQSLSAVWLFTTEIWVLFSAMRFPSVGETYHAIVEVIQQLDETMFMVHDVGNATDCLLCDVPLAMKGRFAVYHLKLQDDTGPMMMAGTKDTWFTEVSSKDSFPSGIVELCAGSGAMGVAASFLGGEILASLDHNALSVEHLRRNHHGCVLQGDVTKIADVLKVHQCVAGSDFILLSGFPCQPFSTQGMQLHGADPRAEVFHGLMEAIFLLQPKAVILECVPGASSDPDVRAALLDLCALMGWTMNDTVLELMHQWPTRRRRWWVLLAPAAWDLADFKAWPAQSRFDSISKVLPSMGEFTLYEEENLMLTPMELQAYANPAYGREDRLLQPHGVCPTMLHSYGSALSGCPCGCREVGFSPGSLESKGLRGFFVLSTLWNAPRFLHPVEAAILHTLPITMKFEGPPRNGLALIGQLAAPLQVLWAYVHLHNASARASSSQVLEPMDVIDKYRNALLAQLQQSFPFALPQPPICITVKAADGEMLSLLTSKHQTIGDLIQAERISLKPEHKIRGVIDGNVVPQCQILPAQAEIELQHFERRDQHVRTGQIALAVCHGAELLVEFGTPGIFVFQLLDSLNLTGVDYVVNTAGRIFGRDVRLWTTQQVTTLGLRTKPSMGLPPHDGLFAPPVGAQLIAHGNAATSPGLDDVSVWIFCQQVVDHFTHLDKPLLIPPLLGLRLLHGEAALRHGDKCLPLEWIGPRIILPLILDGHWTLLWGTRIGTRVYWTCFDGLHSVLHSEAVTVAKTLSCQLRLDFCGITHCALISQHHSHTCGVIALVHLCLALGFSGTFDDENVLHLHNWLRYHNSPSAALRGLGPDQTLHALTDLLGSKGVPSTAAKDRASAAIRTLGKREVDAALNSSNAWAELKKLASRPSSIFKFVHHHELMQVVDQRAKEKHSSALVGKKQKKSSKSSSSKPKELQIDASMVQLPSGYFQDEDGDDIPQITFAEVTVDARGIAVCCPQEVQPFLDDVKSLSSDALGLLVTSDLTAQLKTDQLTSITFPGVYAGTGESVLVSGCLLNLGDVAISRHGPRDLARNIEVAATRVVKLQHLVRLWQGHLGQSGQRTNCAWSASAGHGFEENSVAHGPPCQSCALLYAIFELWSLGECTGWSLEAVAGPFWCPTWLATTSQHALLKLLNPWRPKCMQPCRRRFQRVLLVWTPRPFSSTRLSKISGFLLWKVVFRNSKPRTLNSRPGLNKPAIRWRSRMTQLERSRLSWLRSRLTSPIRLRLWIAHCNPSSPIFRLNWMPSSVASLSALRACWQRNIEPID